jgi:CDP-diacylglycerol--serine O-phosphatidyltransferase
VFIGALFDVFDGLAARALGGGSPLGAQLDSLADMVTFGVAPGMIIAILPQQGRQWLLSIQSPVLHMPFSPLDLFDEPLLLPLLCAMAIVIPSAWRLAKFNIDTRQTSGFLGLPTPANALFWASLPLAAFNTAIFNGPGYDYLASAALTLALPVPIKIFIAILLGILMLSELPLPSLKFKHFQWKGNEVIYLLLGIGAVLVVLYGMLAVPLILVLYLLSPLWGRLFPKVG